MILTRKHRVRNFHKFLTGALGKERKGQKNVNPIFENVRLMSSITSCFVYIILSHTKQQRIPVSSFLESFVITLEAGTEVGRGANKWLGRRWKSN